MSCWIGVKVMFFWVVVVLERKLGKSSAAAGDGDALGHRSPPWRRLHHAFHLSISRHEDDYALLVMGVLCFGMGGLLVRVGLGTVP
jgi:hypothetical protein